MRVLAIDPGERCGWARADISQPNWQSNVIHGITPLKDMALKVFERVGDYDVLVYETFRLTRYGGQRLVGSELLTAQVIGMFRLACWINKVRIVGQGPTIKSTARRSLGPELKAILERMPAEHDNAHDGDAILHLHHYWWKERA